MLPARKTKGRVIEILIYRAYFQKKEMRLILLVFLDNIKNVVAKTLFMYYDKVQNVGVIYPMQTMMKRRLDNHELC